MNLKELAWAAGFYDGEGCTGVNRGNGHAYPLLQLNQTDQRPLARFARAVGQGAIKGPYKYRARPTRSPLWVWYCGNFEGAQATIALLWPWLSEPKREQAIRAFRELAGIRKARAA
jgi:hypothetical protein